MKRWRFAEGFALLAGLLAIAAAPEPALFVIVSAIPVVLFLAGLSVLYLRRMYGRQTKPRSRFFAMLVAILTRGELAGLWIGYIVIARGLNATGLLDLPFPPPLISTAISGLVVLVFLASPIAYAWTIFSIRRRSLERRPKRAEREIDRDGA